jgi:hypothetical protein
MNEEQAFTLEFYANLKHLECDGLTRVLTRVLRLEGIEHEVRLGTIYYPNHSFYPHFWIVLPDKRIVDFRARMWLKGDDIPHGVFDPDDYPAVRYIGSPFDIGLVDEWLFNALVGG